MTTGTRWGRAIGAGILVELSLLALTFLLMFILSKTGEGGIDDNKMMIAHEGALWLTGIAGPVLTFLFARWALRGVSSSRMAHALVATGVAVGIDLLLWSSSVTEGHAPLWAFAMSRVAMTAGGVGAAMLARPTAAAVGGTA